MTKLYLYETPREHYLGDRRRKHDPKYVARTWHTQFETTDYNEILEYINGQTVVKWECDDTGAIIDGTEEYNTPDPVYRVLEQTVVVQEGELVSPYHDFWNNNDRKLLEMA